MNRFEKTVGDSEEGGLHACGIETIQVKNTVYNWGTTEVRVPFTVNFYLSQDARYGGTDVLLGSRQINPPFAGGGRDTDETSLTLPPSGPLPDGPYYIIAYVDEENWVDEIEGGENDNITVAGPMMVYTPPNGVDLIMKEVSGPAGAEPTDPCAGETGRNGLVRRRFSGDVGGVFALT